MKRLFLFGAILIVGLGLFFFRFFYSIDDTQAIEKSIKKENIQVDRIFHIETVEEGTVLAFYATSEGLAGLGMLEKTLFGWKWISGGENTEFESGKALYWSWNILNKSSERFPVYFGIVSNPKIEQVQIDNKHQATIVETFASNRIWFFYGNDTSGIEEIKGLNKQGEVLFSRFQ